MAPEVLVRCHQLEDLRQAPAKRGLELRPERHVVADDRYRLLGQTDPRGMPLHRPLLRPEELRSGHEALGLQFSNHPFDRCANDLGVLPEYRREHEQLLSPEQDL